MLAWSPPRSGWEYILSRSANEGRKTERKHNSCGFPDIVTIAIIITAKDHRNADYQSGTNLNTFSSVINKGGDREGNIPKLMPHDALCQDP